MITFSDLDSLLSKRDKGGLLNALRVSENPSIRMQAARALGLIGDSQAIDALTISLLNDPSPDVKAAAQEALSLLLGNQADDLISSFRVKGIFEEPSTDSEPSKVEESREMKKSLGNATLIATIMENRDWDSLEIALRNGEDTDLRLKAAQAFGEVYDISALECLARSFLEDPDKVVREAARNGLKKIMGEQAERVIAVHQEKKPKNDPWIIDEQVPMGGIDQEIIVHGDGNQDIQWGEEDIDPLITRIMHGPDDQIRRKAIWALAKIADMRGINALIAIVEWGETGDTREEAYQALHEIYGDQTAEVINSFRENNSVEEPGLSEEQIEETSGQTEILQTTQGTPFQQSNMVIQEEKSGLFNIVLLGLLVLAFALIVFLFVRGW